MNGDTPQENQKPSSELKQEINSANICSGGPLDLSWRYGDQPAAGVLPPLCVEPVSKESTLADKLADPNVEADIVSAGFVLISRFPAWTGRLGQLGNFVFRGMLPPKTTEPIIPPESEALTSRLPSSPRAVRYDPVEIKRLMAEPERLSRLSPLELKVLQLRQPPEGGGKRMTAEGIAKELGFTSRGSETRVLDIQAAAVRKLREPIGEIEPESDQHFSLQGFRDQDGLPADLIEPTPEETAFRKTLGPRVERLLGELEPDEATVMKMRWGIGEDRSYDLREIGDRLSRPITGVRGIESRAINRLKYFLHTEQYRDLRDFFRE